MKSVGSLLVFVLWAFIFWPNVESRDGYSYADCTYVKENEDTIQYGRRCFCYNSGRGIKWKDIWSTFQVRVTDNNNDVEVVYPMEKRNCHDPDDLLTAAKCTVEYYWPPSVEHGKTLDIPLVEEDVCFMVKSPRASTEYTLHVSGKRLNKMRFALFIGGLLLYYLSGSICRSSVFYYTTGVSFGIISILLLLLFVMKNFIPKRGVFLVFFGASTGVSYMGFQKVKEAWEDIMKDYWREMLGYLAVTGLISFALCYKRGPITCERTLTLMTWCMQGAAMTMLWAGVSYPPAAYSLMGTMMSLKLLPVVLPLPFAICRLIWRLLCSFLGLFRRRRRPVTRFLTEEEYREQGEVHTRASLEQLRESCRTPGFPAWDTVLKLSNPQRFADFMRNGSHVNASEQDKHERHYGVGGAYYENVFFSGNSSWGPHHGDGDGLNGGGGGSRDDFSEDESEPYVQAPPNPIPTPSPTLPPAQSVFPAYTPPPPTPAPFCPYPLAPAPALYPPLPMDVEEEEEDLF